MNVSLLKISRMEIIFSTCPLSPLKKISTSSTNKKLREEEKMGKRYIDKGSVEFFFQKIPT